MPSSLSPLVFQSRADASDSVFHRFVRHFDWILFFDVVALCLVGMTMVYSACLRFGHPELYFGKQLFAFALGLGILFILATVNYQIFGQYPKTLFAFSLSLLALVLLAGKTSRGTKAWLSLGPVAFQPSEICKLLAILVLAVWCANNVREIHRLKGLVIPFFIILAHVALILLQPDFGSTLVYFPVLLGILYVAGTSYLYLFIILLYGLVAVTVLATHVGFSLVPDFLQDHAFWNFIYRGTKIGKPFLILQLVMATGMLGAFWIARELRLRIPGIYFLVIFLVALAGWSSSSLFLNSLKEYQKKRLTVFFSPRLDPMGAGYHVIQSEVALGSGRIFGKGLFSGTQGRLGFLPEQHTDFIFSVLGEELGFLASGMVLLLYLILLWRCVAIAGDARDLFGSLAAVGIGCMFAFYG
ncbi:MAG: hypothetical protein A2901_09410, partial [Elusimicrobia bacterium RIFCSPLOWO2_01_FULL_54_10]